MREQNDRIYQNRIRRRRQLRCRLIITIVTLCMSAGIGIIGTSFLSRAQSEEPAVTYKYFTSIVVHPGDTLTTIAGEYADDHYESMDSYIEEVRMTNHLWDGDIRAGEYLVVPYYSSEYR